MTEPKKIYELVHQELKDANSKFPQFASNHEAFAVIEEEVEECEEEMARIEYYMDEMWEKVKKNKGISEELCKIELSALHLVQEAIQVAAMCQKGLVYDMTRREE